MLVSVQSFWINPDAVVAVYVRHAPAYHDSPETWSAVLDCGRNREWSWKFDIEEDAHRNADKIADQVNAPAVPRSLR